MSVAHVLLDPTARRPAAESRYAALDGLRGVAALIVVGYHALLVVPAVSAVYVGKVEPAAFTPEWWLYATPLRLLFAGHEAVLVFFVLSGFVLTLPFLAQPPTARSTLAYYGRRIVRLYLPVWGALAFALALALAVPRDPAIGGWLGSHHAPTVHDVWHDALLLFGTSNLNSPLWSLTWEVWFSLLMPLMLSALARFDVIRAALPASWLTADMLQYLPVFGIGMLLAFQKDAIRAASARVRSWWPIVTTAALLTVSPSLIAPVGWGPLAAFAYLLSLVGVLTIVALAFASPARRPLEARPVQWVGTRSFSLYLVHEPILVAAALLVGVSGWWPWVAIAVALVPAILLAAALFYRVLEHPSIGLSRRVGRLIAAPRVRASRLAKGRGPGAFAPGPQMLPDLDSNQEPAG